MQEEQNIPQLLDHRYKTQINNFFSQIYSVEQLPQLLDSVRKGNIIQQHHGMIGLRKIMCFQNPPIQQLIDKDMLPHLLEMVKQHQYPQLQMEAAWILVNVSSGSSQQCQQLVNLGAIPVFSELMRVGEDMVIEQGLWAINNLAGDRPQYRDLLLSQNCISNILNMLSLHPHKQSLVNQAMTALSVICRARPIPTREEARPAIQYLCDKVVNQNIENYQILHECCSAIAAHTNNYQANYDLFKRKGFFIKLIEYLSKPLDDNCLLSVLRVLGNATTSEDVLIDMLLQACFLEALERILQSNQSSRVKRQVCWMLSNVAAGSAQQVETLIQHKSLIDLLQHFFQSQNQTIQKEMCYIFFNLIQRGKPSLLIQFYQQSKVLSLLVDFTLENGSTYQGSIGFTCLISILKFGRQKCQQKGNPIAAELAKTKAREGFIEMAVDSDRKTFNKIKQVFGYLEDDPYFRGVELVEPNRRKSGRQMRGRPQRGMEESDEGDSLSSEG